MSPAAGWRRLEASAFPAVHLVAITISALLAWGVLAKVWFAPGWRMAGAGTPWSQLGPAGWTARAAEPETETGADDRTIPSVRFNAVVAAVPVDATVVYRVRGDGGLESGDVDEAAANEATDTRVPGVGDCRFGRAEDTVWLMTCLDVRGVGTIASSEFERNRRRFDYTAGRVALWVLGAQPIEDRRCLLVRLSTPSRRLSTAEAQQKLAEALYQWRDWWVRVWNPVPPPA
jgi:cyanosortase A-associated protein